MVIGDVCRQLRCSNGWAFWREYMRFGAHEGEGWCFPAICPRICALTEVYMTPKTKEA